MAVKKMVIAEIERVGQKIVIPERVSLARAIEILETKMTEEEQLVELKHEFDTFVWDGAIQLHKIMEELFGVVNAKTIQTLFGERAPALISIPVGEDKTQYVPWGRFGVPGLDSNQYIETKMHTKDGIPMLALSARMRRKNEPIFHAIVRKLLDCKESIYRGKAFSVKYESGDIQMPEFMALPDNADAPIFSETVASALEVNLFTPIWKTSFCRIHGIPLKRGVLLSGKYGTGKTLTARYTAQEAQKNGWSFIYCADIVHFARVIALARNYMPAVVFCEDIDRVLSGERDIEIDEILNIIDGIAGKDNELIVILTTNHIENITPAMLRPGRLDAVITLATPDKSAVEKLLRYYAGNLLRQNEDIVPACELLAGNIPSIIRECVERAKLSAIGHSVNGEIQITGQDLLRTAQCLQMQAELIRINSEKKTLSPAEHMGESMQVLLGRVLADSEERIIGAIEDN